MKKSQEQKALKNINEEHQSLIKDYFKLKNAAAALYYSAYWSSDRLPGHIEAIMWEGSEIRVCWNDTNLEQRMNRHFPLKVEKL